MGWKPTTTPLFEPGEIPGKGAMSNEQSERLDKFAPKNKIGELLGNADTEFDLVQHQIDTLDQIMKVGQHEEIMAFLDDLANAKGLEEQVVDVADPNYETFLRAEYSKENLVATFDETLFVARTRFALPHLFYFGIGDVMKNGTITVAITAIPRWDANKQLDISGLSDIIVPDFLKKVDESIYEFEDMSPSKARKELLKLGFMEQHEIVS